MPTLYVENVPEDIYKALRKRAKGNGKSIAAEVIELLKQHVPADAELKRRQKVFDELAKLRAMPPVGPGPFPSAEEMIREDRER
ncbi:MAG: FitA-like ribbon-helix-helix domain-containing protein [Candidatus Sulfotelmatobacter sp.]